MMKSKDKEAKGVLVAVSICGGVMIAGLVRMMLYDSATWGIVVPILFSSLVAIITIYSERRSR